MKMTKKFIFISAQHIKQHPDYEKTKRKWTLWEEAKTRAPFQDFFLWTEAHLVFGLDIEAVDIKTLRTLYTDKLFDEMIRTNSLNPYRIWLHRKRFAEALSKSRHQHWRVEHSARREFVYDIFVKLYKESPSPIAFFEDGRAFHQFLDLEFKNVTGILENHKQICGDNCICLKKKPGGEF